MEYKDYYKIMGLERSASQDEIKRAYRKLARKYHPDVNKAPDSEQKFKTLGEAYAVLKDPEKRAQYDKYGEQWQQWGQQQQNQQRNSQTQHQQQRPFTDTHAGGFEDFINSMFGERSRYRSHEPRFHQGQDIHAQLNISLEDSYHGAEKTLQLETPGIDEQGQMHYTQHQVKVKIPKGIGHKKQIRLKGQGGKVSGGKSGDLYIEINILPHPLFKLDDKDIWLEVPVTAWEAALGAKITIPTLSSSVNLTIPRRSQTGNVLKLKGKGLPAAVAGDLLVKLKIVIPGTDNPKADALYQQLQEVEPFNPRAQMGGQ